MENAIIPHDYDTWHHCITVDCELELTPDYIQERISSLQNKKDFRTQQFVRLYGQQHRLNVLAWFQRAQAAL